MKKKLWNAALIAVFLLGLVAASSVIAIPEQACEYTYYSDASRTTIIGFRGVYCTHTTGWGSVSAHYDKECFIDCLGGGGGIE